MAQVVLDILFQLGEIDRDPELTRPGREISAFKTAREIANHVVVVTELVDADVTDGLLGERQPQPGTRPALSFSRVFGVSIDILFWMFTTDAAGFPSFSSTLMMANSSSPRARTINFQVPANLSVGSPTIAAEPAKSGIPARASAIAIARKDREASLMSLVPGTVLRRRGSRRR